MTEPSFNAASRILWACACALLLLGAGLAAEVRGRAARTRFARPAELGATTWAVVADAAEAVRVLGEAGVNGRKLLLLTGRWAHVTPATLEARLPTAGSAPPPDLLDADTAVLAAARLGLARDLQVVMPPAAFARRLEEVRGTKELRQGESSFTLPFHGYPRRFAAPDAFDPPGEPVLVVVEPSFFGEGSPASPEAWLRQRGVEVEMGLVAAADPAATADERQRALAFAERAGAARIEVAR